MNTAISLKTRVRPCEDVLFQEIQGEAVLLHLKTGDYFGLDRVGVRIWNLLQTHEALDRVLAAMLEIYDVGEEQCTRDLLDLVTRMEANGLVATVNP